MIFSLSLSFSVGVCLPLRCFLLARDDCIKEIHVFLSLHKTAFRRELTLPFSTVFINL